MTQHAATGISYGLSGCANLASIVEKTLQRLTGTLGFDTSTDIVSTAGCGAQVKTIRGKKRGGLLNDVCPKGEQLPQQHLVILLVGEVPPCLEVPVTRSDYKLNAKN